VKFTATQPKLNRGLAVVGHAVPHKAILPIEKYILATTEQGRVRLSARREDIGIHYWIDAELVESEGVALLPAHLISDFVRNVPVAPVAITVPSPLHADACSVSCLRNNAEMKNAGEDPAEFTQPPLFRDGGEVLLQLDAELLKLIIARTAFAAAEKEAGTWPWSVGLRIEIEEGKAMFAATDSFRLAMYTLPVPDDQLRCKFLVPAKTMEELARILPSEGAVHMLLTPDHNMALFHVELAHLSETLDLSTRLLNYENYINLRNVVPPAWTTRAVMSTQELATTVKLLWPYAHENRDAIHFKFFGEQTERLSLIEEANTVSLETIAQDMGSSKTVIGAQVQGPDQEIYLNAKYLSEVLDVLDTPKVALEVTASNRPAVLKPIGPGEYVYVMMPMTNNLPGTHQVSVPQRSGVEAPVAANR
jgi:DNA polymerase-3 subunit beta